MWHLVVTLLQWLQENALAALALWFRKSLWAVSKFLWRFYRAPPAIKAYFYLGLYVVLLKFLTALVNGNVLQGKALAVVARYEEGWRKRLIPWLDKQAAIPLPAPRR